MRRKTVFLKVLPLPHTQQKRYVVPFRGSSSFVLFFLNCVCVCVRDFVRLQILFSSFRVKLLKQEILCGHQLIKNKPKQIWNSTGIGPEHNENRIGIWLEPDQNRA